MLYDKDIREPLFEFLENTYGKVRIIEEKRIRKCRADVVMVQPDALTGIEIKSDADTYTRLEQQVKYYNLFFDYNILVVGSTHGPHAKEHVPEWWGILSVEEQETEDGRRLADFYWYRKPEKNPKAHYVMFLKRQLSFLWRPELVHVQELNNMPKYKEKSKKFVTDKIFEKVDHTLLKEQICEELFERDYNTIAAKIEEYKNNK